MKILVINSGSSSLKYQLIDMDNESVLCKGLCERIGLVGSSVTHKAHGKEWKVQNTMPTHAEAFSKMLDLMTTGDGAVLQNKADIGAIGHRVVHGGEKFAASVIINDEVIKTIEELSPLAPLHNPPQVQGIRSAQKVFGMDVPQVAVFDTAFHQTMDPKAYIFAIPYEFYESHSIRRYGFHGTSHRYVAQRAAEFLGRDFNDFKVVTCHLGNGASMAAVLNGKSIDTTMGLTPLGGLMMGTRSGDLDPSVATYLADITGEYGANMSKLLNTKSGFLGVSGISSDNRDIEAAAAEGNERAQLVHDMYSYQIKKYIGAYAAAMNGLDCVVFTGGIGENSPSTRSDACQGMEFFGIEIDETLNLKRGEEVDFSTPDAKVRTLVIPTDEELMIARDTLELV
ncbi:acetate kinase [Ruminococcaceae bacterium OttesenSCG-928-A16]|nr:acetate kinase [Ruminococcaceae bacterium OttesenSCG-928-A16]